MIKRITIQNYMAHKETVLELGPGVSVLTGPNNTGKSAVVEALRSLAQNPPPHHVIRHGANQAVVRAELDSGEVIEWVRSKGNTIYRLFRPKLQGDGMGHTEEVYAKFGRTPPDDIRNLLRLDLVETESGSIDIHIGNQRYPIFLLDQTGSQAASFFAASTEAEYLLRMQQALKAKTDHARSRRKELLHESAATEKELEHFVPLDGLEVKLAAAESTFEKLTALQRSLPLIEKTIGIVSEAAKLHVAKIKCCAVLDFLSIPPETFETRGLEQILRDLESGGGQLKRAVSCSEALISLSNPPLLKDTAVLELTVGSLLNVSRLLGWQQSVSRTLAELDGPPTIHETQKLQDMVREMDLTQGVLERVGAKGAVLAEVMEPPQTTEVTRLQEMIDQWETLTSFHEVYETRRNLLGTLRVPMETRDPKPLSALISVLQEAEDRLRGTEQLSGFLSELTPCPEAVAVAGQDELIRRMLHLQDSIQQNESLQQGIGFAIEEKRREVREAIEEAGACPLCGQALDMDHFLEDAHA